MDIPKTPEGIVQAIADHIDGWRSATFGWQDDPDPVKARRNQQFAIQAHAAECIRRIRDSLAALSAEGVGSEVMFNGLTEAETNASASVAGFPAPTAPAGGEAPTRDHPTLGVSVEDALVRALEARGYRTDGDTLTLAQRCHLMALEDRDCLAMYRALNERYKSKLAHPSADLRQIQAKVEAVAAEWDGCFYENSIGGDIDIGAAIRSSLGTHGIPTPAALDAGNTGTDGGEVDAGPKLTVWYGSMPESNGRTNWTAILHRGDMSEGHTIDRSQYPGRVRWAADRVRWLIGELDKEPYILDYDGEERTPCHLCGGSGQKDGKPCWGLNFEGTAHDATPGMPGRDGGQQDAPGVDVSGGGGR